MSLQILIFSYLLSLLVLLFGTVMGMANEVSPPTINAIVAGVKSSENSFLQLNSFLINCERKKTETIAPSRFSGGYINVAFIVAKSGSRWFTSKAFTEVGQKNHEGHNIVRGVFTPLEPDILLLKNHLSLEWDQSSVHAIVDHFTDGHFNLHGRFDYFRHIGWNMSRYLVESENKSYDTILKDFEDLLDHPFLPEFLEQNREKYVVHPNTEDVDGFRCWVVEYPGMDKMWIDVEHGFAVRKRIYHFGEGKPRKFAIRNQEWKEVAPDLWLPHKQTVDKYVSILPEDPKIWDQVTARMYYEVNEILINSVPDELFDVILPVGTHVVDIARDARYTIWDPNVDPFAGPIEQALKVNRHVKYRALGIIIGSIIIFIAVWQILSRMEKRQK